MAEEDHVDMNSGGNKHPGEATPKPKAPPIPFWIPETRNYVHGSAADLDQRLKAAGNHQAEGRASADLPR